MFLVLPVIYFFSFGFIDVKRELINKVERFLRWLYLICCISLMLTGVRMERVFRADFCSAQYITLLGFTSIAIFLDFYNFISAYIRKVTASRKENQEKLEIITRVSD